MLKKDLWWLFVLGFVLLIAGIHSLRWLAQPAVAATPDAAAQLDAFTTPAGMRHSKCETRHWRKMVMHD